MSVKHKQAAARRRALLRFYITVSLRGPSKTIRLPGAFLSKEEAFAAINFDALYAIGLANGHRKIIGASVSSAYLPHTPREVLYP